MSDNSINPERLLGRLAELGDVGRDGTGQLVRLAATDSEKLGRDTFISWIRQAGLELTVDRIGNIFGIWKPTSVVDEAPLMLGSHIDTAINAGIYDGCYGVLSGLEVIETLLEVGFEPSRPIVVAAFTNEEGVRYAPDMMGSLVYAGGLDVEIALATVGTDDSVLGSELERIGYNGEHKPGFMRPYAYIELHIEQGPVLEREGVQIGAVENLQGISWQKVTIEGDANHADLEETRRWLCRRKSHYLPLGSGEELEYPDRRYGRMHGVPAKRHQRHLVTGCFHRRSAGSGREPPAAGRGRAGCLSGGA